VNGVALRLAFNPISTFSESPAKLLLQKVMQEYNNDDF
jgi:hypothetical protein